MEVVHVLLLEDHEGEARLNQRLLERSYTTEFRFESFRLLHEAIAALKDGAFDVALVDLNVPDSQGIDTFLELQTAAPQLPCVIVSAVADDRIAQAAIRHGAQDYLVKGSITSEILTRVVLYSISRKQAMGGAGQAALNTTAEPPVPAAAGIDGETEGSHLETRFQTLVEQSQDGVFVLSEGKIVFANRVLAGMLGFDIAELMGKNLSELVSPEDKDVVLDNYRRRIAGEDVENQYEFMAQHRNGSRLRVQLSVGRIPLRDGFGLMGTLKDVSERYRASYLMGLQQRLAVELAYANKRDEIYDHVLQVMLRIESVDIAAIYIQDIGTGHFRQAAWRGVRGPFPSAETEDSFEQMHDRLIRESSPLFLNAESLLADRFGQILSPPGIRAFGLIPVMHGGMSIAALDVATLTADVFDEPIQHTLQSIASLLGGVLARMLAEEAGRESELLYRAVVEKSHDAIFIYRDDRLIFANEKAIALTGYNREELISMNPWSLIHPEDRSRIQSFASLRATDKTNPVIYEGRVLTKDGTIRTGEFAGTLIRYEGEPASLVTVRDMTSRKTQEEELKRSDALIRAAGFAASKFLRTADWEDGIMEVLERFGAAANVCRVVIFENVPDEQGARIMRQRAVWVRPEMRDSMIDRVPDGFSFDDDPFRRWASELSAGNPISGIIDNLPNEEQVFLARQNVRSLAVLPVFCGDHWWGIIRFDECRLRRTWLRSELEAMGVSAETLGAAIRRKQAEEELLASREQALKADAIKKSFIANISHEVRTPVNIMLGYLALVAELIGENVGEEIYEYVTAINDASMRLIRTVDSVLNISRFQARDIAIATVHLRLDKLLWDCGQRFRHQAEEKGVVFTFQNDCGAVEIFGDQYYLTESFENLIDNAVKFTASGSITLRMSYCGEQQLMIELTDTGIGISEAFLEKVFDPYLQEDMGYDRMYEGIGLGLTLVKLYLEAHGAVIDIQSKKGEGTRIAVTFPRAITIADAAVES
ncbi:MAG: PAS domain S-box protein [Bacteroidota bacterium]|jgi:PAS domain S-box-containing protein